EIVPDEDDDVYIEATPLARKVPVVDYQIVHINNKPHYKIIRADGTHQLYVGFITLLKNFDREDLEPLWSLDIDWDVAIDHVKQKAKEDPYVQRLDYFKGMSYDDICPIFKAKFNSNIKFLLKSKEQIEEEENR
nr:hypothetical protein [Tanacetum cinerariifolium]